jgi:hypothetical protein
MLALDQVLDILGHVLPILGLRQASQRLSASRSGYRGISALFREFLGLGFM